MLPPLSSDAQARVLRGVVGIVYLACAAMIVLALLRFADLIVPRYGNRFNYTFLVFGGVACWMAYRGLKLLFGRTGERVRKV